jgi:hypothetical protein
LFLPACGPAAVSGHRQRGRIHQTDVVYADPQRGMNRTTSQDVQAFPTTLQSTFVWPNPADPVPVIALPLGPESAS